MSASVWRRARRNTARSVKAVAIARAEYEGCPPRVVRGSALHAATASAENHTMRLPRARRPASYSAQLVTRCRCFGMQCLRSAFALNGKRGVPGWWRGLAPASNYLQPPKGAIRATRRRQGYLLAAPVRAPEGAPRPAQGIVAAAAAIRTAAYWMLRRGVAYADLGADHFDRVERTRLAARLARKLDELGFDVTLIQRAGATVSS